MANKLPKIKIEATVTERFIDLLITFASAAAIIYSVMLWTTLPEIVPTKFGVGGQIKDYGNKLAILSMVPVTVILYVALSLLQRVPHIYNYMVKITEENAEQQYRLGVGLMRMIKLQITVLFAFLTLEMTLSAREGRMVMGIWIVPVFLIFMFGCIIRYFIKSVKVK